MIRPGDIGSNEIVSMGRTPQGGRTRRVGVRVGFRDLVLGARKGTVAQLGSDGLVSMPSVSLVWITVKA